MRAHDQRLFEHTHPGGVPHLRFGRLEVPKIGPVVDADVLYFADLLGEELAQERVEEFQARLSRFATRFHLDEPTARTLQRVVKAIGWNHYLLLEGPAGTGKTSLIQWGAALLGSSVERVNFHLTTDPGDVLAKHAPKPGGGFEILEGPVAVAAREGHTVLLDEPNLAPASVLDALLPAMEPDAIELRIPEVGLRIPIHPDFRILGAINPVDAHHQGRRPMSRPLRSRMHPYIVSEPSPEEVGAAIRKLTRGVVPKIPLQGRPWAGPESLPLYPRTGALIGMDSKRCEQLGRFVQDLAERTRERVIGSTRREPYVVDRRRVDQFLSEVECSLAFCSASDPVGELWNGAFEDAFLNGFEPGMDRETVAEQALALMLYPLAPTDLHVPAKRGTIRGPRSIFSGIEVGDEIIHGGDRYKVDRIDNKGVRLVNRKTAFKVPRTKLYGSRDDDGAWRLE